MISIHYLILKKKRLIFFFFFLLFIVFLSLCLLTGLIFELINLNWDFIFKLFIRALEIDYFEELIFLHSFVGEKINCKRLVY
jgi:hypothetical protein